MNKMQGSEFNLHRRSLPSRVLCTPAIMQQTTFLALELLLCVKSKGEVYESSTGCSSGCVHHFRRVCHRDQDVWHSGSLYSEEDKPKANASTLHPVNCWTEGVHSYGAKGLCPDTMKKHAFWSHKKVKRIPPLENPPLKIWSEVTGISNY